MPIPHSQLETWSHQGPIISSSTTYQSIKNALEHSNSPISQMISSGAVKVYLQGSYANDTNIRGDSDVDVVVELTDAFHSNKHQLTPPELQLHEQVYSPASYGWNDLRNDVIKALNLYYGESYVDTSGNKSIKVLPNSGRLRADVVPVVSYRKYHYFNGMYDHSKDDGVSLTHMTTKSRIVNYPEKHYQNGVQKHQNTNKLFKPTVRMIKNAVSYLVDNGTLKKEVAPSYFLQCMVYNIPPNLFDTDLTQTYCNVVNHLHGADLSSFTCQHEMHNLFGADDTSWNEIDARVTLNALIDLWNEWYTA
jgi:predicted nucleotidyltransferase